MIVNTTQPREAESKLKTLFLGTPEQREERRAYFAEQGPSIKSLARTIFEPGYAFRECVYTSKKSLKYLLAVQGVMSTLLQAQTIDFSIKLAEYLQ